MNEDVWSEEYWEEIDNEWDYCQREYESSLHDELDS